MSTRYRLLALDVDGTSIDSQGKLRPRVADRIGAARERGVVVVFCTGRRFRTTLPLIEALDLQGPVVLHNGAIVKDCVTGETQDDTYLSHDEYERALAILRRGGAPLCYVDRYHDQVDVLVERGGPRHPFQAEYVDDNSDVIDFVDSLDPKDGGAPSDVILMSRMADEESLLAARAELEHDLGDRLHTNFLMNKAYDGFILEVVSSRSGKWPALLAVAEGMGIAREEIMAIGDDNNDANMVEEAGLGIAMGNAVEAVRQVANEFTDDNDNDGVARAIERFLLRP